MRPVLPVPWELWPFAAFVATLLVGILAGCGGAIANVTGDATTGAIHAADTPQAKQEEADAAQNAGGAAAQGAVTVLTSPDTVKRLTNEEAVLGGTFRAQLGKALDDADARVRAWLAELNALLDRVPGVVAAAREQGTGAPLRADIDAAAPHLAALVQSAAAAARAEADAEIAKWRGVAMVAIGVGIGAAVLVVVLSVLHARLMRAHGRLLSEARKS